jgi:glycosyltransferase involved in cell wall biosynthesis
MKKFLLLFLVLCTFLEANEEKKPAVCLNMIVKNETKVIKRCLESVKPLIDYWVIVDTGSTDGTQEMIKDFMKDIPGELHERPWVNFAHNRNEALNLAKTKADYLLFIDADDTLAYAPDFKKPKLDKDCYYIKIKYGGMSYDRIQLIKSTPNWKWAGVVHEVLVSDTTFDGGFLNGVTMVIVGGGDRSHDPKKFEKDAALLEKAVQDDPTCGRHVFYLAQSYRDAGKLELALKNYEKRFAMGGWDQEVYWSLYQIAILQEDLNYPEETVSKSYVKAYNYRPTRAEPLYRLSSYYRRKENYLLGYLVAQLGLQIKEPNDVLFVESWMYDYGLLLEHSISSYWLEKYQESWQSCVQILARNDIPQHVRECSEKNLGFALEKLKEKALKEQAITAVPSSATDTQSKK